MKTTTQTIWYFNKCTICTRILRVNKNFKYLDYHCPKCRNQKTIRAGYLSGDLNKPIKWYLN